VIGVGAGARRSGALGVLAALALLVADAPCAQARAAIDPPEAPVATQPLLLDLVADVTVAGRAKPRATVYVFTPCVLPACSARVRANRKGRWRAVLHVVARRTTSALTVYAGDPRAQEPDDGESFPLAPAPVVPGAPELVMIGDSLAQGTAPYLPEMLPGWRVSADAARSRFLLPGMAIRDALRKPPSRPVAVAFSLFTNDDPRRVADLVASAQRSLDGFAPGSCALWATIARPKVGGVSYRAANDALQALARKEPRIVLVPWAKAVKAHPRWLREDRVHATDEGYRARAALYAQAATACGL
jgi:hypothetical protein